jgi:hypothetical protein
LPGIVFILVLSASTDAGTAQLKPVVDKSECVILLHGLARTAASMNRIEQALIAQGYTVSNLDYPSTQFRIEKLVDQNLKPVIDRLREHKDCQVLHFVTHSMGGILVRYYLKHNTLPQLGKIVMISPPNKGSELVDKLGGLPIFKWLNGPAGAQLGTALDSLPNTLGAVNYDVGVIAGNGSLNPLYSCLIPGDDDGKVSVSRARLDGMNAFVVVPNSHTFIVRNHTVIDLVMDYLARGAQGWESESAYKSPD